MRPIYLPNEVNLCFCRVTVPRPTSAERLKMFLKPGGGFPRDGFEMF